jgi:hypothetical protein
MPTGRPRLRIGQHGNINRRYLGGGVWEASCRYRDSDGVVRKVQRLGPPDEFDKHGKLAEDALIEALAERRAPSADQISLDTLLVCLVDQHLTRLSEDGRSPVTLSTYRFAADKLAKFIGGVRVGEASTGRLDAALRSMRAAHHADRNRPAAFGTARVALGRHRHEGGDRRGQWEAGAGCRRRTQVAARHQISCRPAYPAAAPVRRRHAGGAPRCAVLR